MKTVIVSMNFQMKLQFSSLNAFSLVGDLYIWGKNWNKCLGLGDQEDQFFPLKVFIGVCVECLTKQVV